MLFLTIKHLADTTRRCTRCWRSWLCHVPLKTWARLLPCWAWVLICWR
jgi:hypothetical protein